MHDVISRVELISTIRGLVPWFGSYNLDRVMTILECEGSFP